MLKDQEHAGSAKSNESTKGDDHLGPVLLLVRSFNRNIKRFNRCRINLDYLFRVRN